MSGFRGLCVASCVALLVACAAALPTASAGGSATVAKSACADAKAKLRKDEQHHASKAKLKKDRQRANAACKKKPGGGGTGGNGTGGSGTCTVTYAQFLGAAYQVSFQCTAAVGQFTVTTNKTLTGTAVGRGDEPNNRFSCTQSAHSFTCTGPSNRYYLLETQFYSSDDCEPFTGTVTVNGKDYPFQGNCTPPNE